LQRSVPTPTRATAALVGDPGSARQVGRAEEFLGKEHVAALQTAEQRGLGQQTSAPEPQLRYTVAAMPATKPSKTKTAKKQTVAKRAPGARKDFSAVFTALCGLLKPYEDRLVLKTVSPGYCYLESRTPTYKNRPMFFAAVRAGKNYVSYHLVPVYACPELGKRISLALKKRMQGKACFNFVAPDRELFQELEQLTAAGFQKFKSLEYL